jgi:hypothetical protein
MENLLGPALLIVVVLFAVVASYASRLKKENKDLWNLVDDLEKLNKS